MQSLRKKKYKFSSTKNAQLIEERNISFEEIIEAIMDGKTLTLKPHHNQTQYSHQELIYVYLKEQVFIVPCVKEDENTFFLKTIYPSSKIRDLYFPKLK